MRNNLIMKYPASWHGDMWREGIPLGNGEIGALIYGSIWKEIIMLSHSKLWHCDITPEMPDVSDTLPIMRELLAKNDPLSAERIMADTFEERGYKPMGAKPLPLCDISILTHTEKPFKKYLRELNMEIGEASVSWNEGNSRFYRKTFVSRANDCICCEMTVEGDARISADLSFTIHDLETKGNITLPTNITCIAERNYIKYSATKDNGIDFGAVARFNTDGDVTYHNDVAVVKNASYIVMFSKVFIEDNHHIKWGELENELNNMNLNYNLCKEAHANIHSNLFNAMQFNIGGTEHDKCNEELLLDAYQGEASNTMIEKLWSFGRYLLISASKEGGYPCQLYGLWTGNYNAIWAINMFNENLQMIYWQALSGNMPNLLIAVFDYVESMIDDYRENAQKLYACRGINLPAVSTPESGLHKCIYPHILHWTGGAGWLCQHYYDYYLHTGNVEFLKNRAMPFMYETALFYEDFLTLDENGFFVSSPSNSPENTPKNLKPYIEGNCWHEVVANATMDFAIIKELLTNLIKGAKITGEYSEKISKWEDMMTHIPPYQVNEDGAIREWMHDFYEDNYEHRHQSHIYPIFPGVEVTKEHPLYSNFVIAIKKRMVVGLKDQSGWSLAHMANSYARMSEGDLSLECLDILTRTNLMSNFLTVSNDWRRMGMAVCGDFRVAPVQIDAIMGITAAVQEMLLFSTENKLYILPALPKRWKNGEVKGLLARGNILVDIKWDVEKNLGTLTLLSQTNDVKISVEMPNSKIISVTLRKGEYKVIEF